MGSVNLPEDCAVCLEPLTVESSDANVGIPQTPCNHIFHRKCFLVWITNVTPGNCCPLCKRTLQLINDDQEIISGRNPSSSRTSSSFSFQTFMNGFQGNDLELIYQFHNLLCHDKPVIRSLAVVAFFLMIFLWLVFVFVFLPGCVRHLMLDTLAQVA